MESIPWANAWLPNIQGLDIRIILIILASYPIAYRYYQEYDIDYPDATPDTRNQYILFTGLGLSLLLNRWDTLHSFFTIIASYYICYFALQYHCHSLGVMAVWLFNAGYLLASFLLFDPSYWNVTQSILCLRLMGFSIDLLDSNKNNNNSNTLYSIKEIPEFQYVLGYCYFPSAFLIGPQFPYALYQKFLARKEETARQSNDYIGKVQDAYSTRCLVLGLVYLGTRQMLTNYFPAAYLLTDDYSSLSFLYRLFVFLLSGKLVFMKYIGLWLLTEGATAYFGISYTGLDDGGEPNFEGLCNVKPLLFETNRSSTRRTYNMTIHEWFDYYCMKRKRGSFYQIVILSLLWLQNPWLCLSLFGLNQVEKVISCSNVSVNKFLSWVCTHSYLYYGIVGFDSMHLLYPTVDWALHIIMVAALAFQYYLNRLSQN